MSARDLKGALRLVHETMHGEPFAVSVLAAVNGIGVGEAVALIQAGVMQGWLAVADGTARYELTEEGVACVA